MKRWSIFLVALATLGIASTASADPLKDPLPWVGPQILSIINKQNVWTPTDFAIARGDFKSLDSINPNNSVSKLRIAKDVLRKSGNTLPGNQLKPNDTSTFTLPNILGTLLLWSNDGYWK